MRRLLILTTLDMLSPLEPTNRDHHLLDHFAPKFTETYVVLRRRPDKGGWRHGLVDALVPRARIVEREGITYLHVNPMLNHYQGMLRDVTGTSGVEGTAAARPGGVRRIVYTVMNGFGILKELSTILFLTWFTWRRAPGQFDLCVAFGPWAAAATLLLCRLGKVRLYIYEDRDYEPGFVETALRKRWALWLENRGIRRADVRVSTAYRLARLRHQQIGVEMTVITNGAPLAQHEPAVRTAPVSVLVYTGNIAPWSGVDLVIEALPAIRASVPEIRFFVVGAGLKTYRQHLEARVAELGLGDIVTFVGFLPYEQMLTHLNAGGIGMAVFRPVALREFAFPMKVVDYMAAGLPTIATVGTEAEDILTRHDCGLAVPFDVDALARAVIDLLGDPARYSRLCDNARTAIRDYDWPVLMEREYQLAASAFARAEAG